MYAVNCPMPKNCYSCPFFAVYEGCRFAPFEKIVDPPDISKGRPIWCPLLEVKKLRARHCLSMDEVSFLGKEKAMEYAKMNAFGKMADCLRESDTIETGTWCDGSVVCYEFDVNVVATLEGGADPNAYDTAEDD